MQIPNLTVCTGRIKTFIEAPEKRTMAPSCTLYVYDNDLEECLLFVDQALRGGAGVKVHLEKFVKREKIKFDWKFYLPRSHQDSHLLKAASFKDLLVDIENLAYNNYAWISVDDSMDENRHSGRVSIRNSWLDFINLASMGRNIVVDLSALRPAGTINRAGLCATGPLGYGDGDGSFLSVYDHLAKHLRTGDIISLMQLLGQLNRVLRRGGTYKNGIVCFGLDYRHSDVNQFLKVPLSELPGGQKKAIRIDEGILEDLELSALVVQKLNDGGLFLEKKNLDKSLYSNVCVEILQKHRGTCLLSHANAAKCASPQDLVEALVTTTVFLTELHLKWRSLSKSSGIYLPLQEDRQIGVGWCGWANFLRRMGVSYREHVEALEAFWYNLPYHGSTTAIQIADCLVTAYFRATRECDRLMSLAGQRHLDRIFTIAPCQRNWIDYKDPDGYALCRSIDPPFDRYEFRDSHTDASSIGRYDHGDVEIMLKVGHDLHQRHWEVWQQMMNFSDRAHTMSFDLWKKVDQDWFRSFVQDSTLQTTYYQFADKLNQQYLNKGMLLEAVDSEEQCIECSQ